MSSLLVPFEKTGKPQGLELSYLQGDSRLVIVAGSDTTAATLSFLFYHLATERGVVDKIREELASHVDADGNVSNADIVNCEYLNGCINEALRLHPPVPSRVHRKTPPEGVEIGGQHIPGNVEIWCPQYVIGRNEDAYDHSREFIPERWYSKTSMVTNRSSFAPFSQGMSIHGTCFHS